MNQALRAKDTLMLSPQAMTNSATVTAILDTQGAAQATIRIPLAAEVNTNAIGPTISLLESDDTVETNAVTVTADRTAEDLTAEKELRYEVNMLGRKRYLRLDITTETTTNDNVTVAAIGTLTRNAEDPNSTSDMADAVVLV